MYPSAPQAGPDVVTRRASTGGGIGIALGVLIFSGFVVFARLTPLAFCLSMADGSGDPVGLIGFGLAAGSVLGVPGHFAIPYRRRYQALGWLAFASMVYLPVAISIVTLAKRAPIPVSPENRESLNQLTVHYGWVGVTMVVEAGMWVFLFRRDRLAGGVS